MVASFVAEAEVYLASGFQRSAKSVRRSIVMYSCAIHHRGADFVIIPVHCGGGVHIPAVGMRPGGIQATAHAGQVAVAAPAPVHALMRAPAAQLHADQPPVFLILRDKGIVTDGAAHEVLREARPSQPV